MPNILRAFLIIITLGSAWGLASAAEVKEFQTREGLVRIYAAQASAPASDGAPGLAVPVPGFDLDSITDLTILPPHPVPADPLLDIFFADHLSGEELRFPVKLSQLQEFLRGHAGGFNQPSADARSVAMVRALCKDMKVHMVEPGTGDSK